MSIEKLLINSFIYKKRIDKNLSFIYCYLSFHFLLSLLLFNIFLCHDSLREILSSDSAGNPLYKHFRKYRLNRDALSIFFRSRFRKMPIQSILYQKTCCPSSKITPETHKKAPANRFAGGFSFEWFTSR